MSTHEAGKKLVTRLWKTRGSRFAARERLRRTNLLSVTTITMLSVYVIVSSVALVAFSGQLLPVNEKWLNIINIGLSVLAIVFSLIEFSRDYLGWAESMNESALQIGEIYSELSVKVDGGVVTQQDIDDAERRYSEVLQKNKSNHQPIDYSLFKLSAPGDFPEWWLTLPIFRIVARVWFAGQSMGLYLLGMLLFPLLALVWGDDLLVLREGFASAQNYSQ